MSVEQNIATQKRLAEGINSGNLHVMFDVFAPNVVDHDPAPDQVPGPEGYVQFFGTMRTAFPDLNIKTDDMVTDEDSIAIAYTLSGTQNGPFLGVPPSGKYVSVRGMQIARFQDGKIVERWGATDELGILRQIGVNPTASAAQPSQSRA